jgi:hypothetical protein
MGYTLANWLSSKDERQTMSKTNEIDPEISAITAVHTALKGLEREAQARVLQYVAAKLVSRVRNTFRKSSDLAQD